MDPKINHLLWRAGFGTNPNEVRRKGWQSVEDVIEDLFISKRKTIKTEGTISRDAFKKDPKAIRSRIVKMNLDWLNEMATTEAVLQEKMCLFWHDHFGVKANLPIAGAQHNNTLRKFALGKFGDLLHAVAKDPAMLLFLNNQQNQKSAPNENFARELFELFTLGEGNYTENDVKEAARAFTGWKTDKTGTFRFVKFQHDYGRKRIFGRSGNFTGEQVIDMVLNRPETAQLICNKILDFMVGEQLEDQIRSEMTAKFRSWDLHIGKLLREIFEADWFYDAKVMGSRIKSPIELLVGLMRAFQLDSKSGFGLLTSQRSLGQVLFSPPSVAGWPSGTNWIDSSSLLFRQNLGFAILQGRELKGIEKKSFDARMKDLDIKIGNKMFLPSTSYWEKTDLVSCCDFLFAVKPKREVLHSIKQISSAQKEEKEFGLAMLLGLPEYQLC